MSGVRFPLCPFVAEIYSAAATAAAELDPPPSNFALNYAWGFAWFPVSRTHKKRPPPGFSMAKKATNCDVSEEFWSDDAAAIAERERVQATGFRMPKPAKPDGPKPATMTGHKQANTKPDRPGFVSFIAAAIFAAVVWFLIGKFSGI